MKSNRKKWVLAYLDENKPSAAQSKKIAKAMAKALNHDIIGKVLKHTKLK